MVAACFWAFEQIESATAARITTHALITRADAVLSALKDAETGQRGFSLSGDEAYLQPYRAAHDDVVSQLKALQSLSSNSAGNVHLDALIPLVDAKLAHMAQVIALRRGQLPTPAQTAFGEGNGEGKRLMDSIRAAVGSFIEVEENVLVRGEADLQSNMRRLFVIIITASVLMFLFAALFAYLIFRETRQRLKGLVHLETRRLLAVQEETTRQLQQTNAALMASEGNLAVTLNSIGDAVIATDATGRVTRLNPLAELLTGWARAEATG